jgi:hypothetical protein
MCMKCVLKRAMEQSIFESEKSSSKCCESENSRKGENGIKEIWEITPGAKNRLMNENVLVLSDVTDGEELIVPLVNIELIKKTSLEGLMVIGLSSGNKISLSGVTLDNQNLIMKEWMDQL